LPATESTSVASKVAIFGAGVAGLTAAHELVRRGYQVAVYESNDIAGGFFRSARRESDNLPTEYSWHGFGPWYHNTFDILRQIPFDDEASLYDRILSRPMEYAVVPNRVEGDKETADFFEKPTAFRMTASDKISLAWGIIKAWSAKHRSKRNYSHANAAAYWQPRMTPTGHRTWKALFGPWIGADWPYASLHHVGLFFGRNIRSGPPHKHPADDDGPAWEHRSMGGWSLLNGPSNEVWFDRWVEHLEDRGVVFHWQSPLETLHFDGAQIAGASLSSGDELRADIYVLASTPFASSEIVERTPVLLVDPQLTKLRPASPGRPAHSGFLSYRLC
jgi:glycine/D-amino acid oxidase-like deaminating enzyme